MIGKSDECGGVKSVKRGRRVDCRYCVEEIYVRGGISDFGGKMINDLHQSWKGTYLVVRL